MFELVVCVWVEYYFSALGPRVQGISVSVFFSLSCNFPRLPFFPLFSLFTLLYPTGDTLYSLSFPHVSSSFPCISRIHTLSAWILCDWVGDHGGFHRFNIETDIRVIGENHHIRLHLWLRKWIYMEWGYSLYLAEPVLP